MDSKDFVSDKEIELNLEKTGFTECTADKGRLMLLELLSKAGAGYYNSHTEENFLRSFGLMKKDRTLNKKGRKFMCAMVYNHSNLRPEGFYLMEEYKREPKPSILLGEEL